MRNHHGDWTTAVSHEMIVETARFGESWVMKRIQSCSTILSSRIDDPLWGKIVNETTEMAEEVCGGGGGGYGNLRV